MKNKIIQIIIRNQSKLALFSLAILVFLGVFSKIPKIDGNINGFNLENLKQYQNGVKIAEKFSSSKFIQVNINPEETKATHIISYLEKLEEDLNQEVSGIRIRSLHQSNRLLEVGKDSDESIQSVLERAKELPIVEQIISKNAESFLLLVFVDSEDEFNLEKFNKILYKESPYVKSINVLSSFHMADTISNAIQSDLVLLTFLIITFFSILILITYKSISALVFSMLIIGVAIFPVFFFFNLLSIPINLTTVLVIPILLVLSLADAIHLLTGFRSVNHIEGHDEKLTYVLQKYFIPSLITSLTTAVAFFSFQFNSSDNIKDFGLITGFAVLIAFILTYGLGCYLLKFVKCKNSKKNKIALLSRHFASKKAYYSIGLGILSILSFIYLPSLKFNTDLESFIPTGTVLEKDQQIINEQYYSRYKLEVMLEKKDSTSSSKKLRKEVVALHKKLEKQEEVGHVSSIKDQLDFKSKFGLMGGMVKFPKEHNPYHTKSKDAYRLDVRLQDTKDLPKIEKFIQSYFSENESEYSHSVFSYALMLKEMNALSAQSLLYSLFFSSLFISLLILIMTRSIIHTLISVIANIVPLSMMILVFYFFNLDLNLLTALTSIICIGLVVDDTIHVLYRRLILKSELEEVSFGILTTSIILFGGFMMFAISNFIPSQTFGITCAVIFLVTVISDLTLLPYLLDFVSKKEKA
jgi:predicted RND superfamily exporter protein